MYGAAARQEDYNGDAELVPSGLRVYRHYKMTGRRLGSTITSSPHFEPGVNTAECYAVESTLADKHCETCAGRGVVYVRVPYRPGVRFNPFDIEPGFDSVVKMEPCKCLRKCEAPNRNCTCGFYASYSPDTDFFASHNRPPGMYGVPAPPVFAVVEASGRVLMGSRGVRAERMRVTAVCLDMGHINVAVAATLEMYRDILSSSYDYSAGRFHPGGPVRHYGETLDHLLYQLDGIAHEYGVKSYGRDLDRMIRDHPQPDLSHLIENQDMREVPPWRI